MYLLRHGQSLFNLHFTKTRQDPGIEDPELTPLGHQQAREAAERLAGVALTRIIVSPYTRALQTVEPIARRLGLAVEVMHEVRERFVFSCDVGRHRDLLADQFPHHRFDHLPDQWWGDAIETPDAIQARADAFRLQIRDGADHATTLLVSHWAFILALAGVSAENGQVLEFDPRGPQPARFL